MVRSQLVLRIAARQKHLVQKDSEIAVDLIIGAINSALAQGRRIEVRDFGSFMVRQRKARKACNPRTGEAVEVPAKPKIYFRATGELKRRVKTKTGSPKVKAAKKSVSGNGARRPRPFNTQGISAANEW